MSRHGFMVSMENGVFVASARPQAKRQSSQSNLLRLASSQAAADIPPSQKECPVGRRRRLLGEGWRVGEQPWPWREGMRSQPAFAPIHRSWPTMDATAHASQWFISEDGRQVGLCGVSRCGVYPTRRGFWHCLRLKQRSESEGRLTMQGTGGGGGQHQ